MNNDNRQSDNQPVQWYTLSDELMNLSTEKANSQPGLEVEQNPQNYQGRIDQESGFESSISWQGSIREVDAIGITKNSRTIPSKNRDDDWNEKKPTPVRKKKKYWPVVLTVAMAFVLIGGGIFIYFNVHLWDDATCAMPKTCWICGKTEGKVLAHHWVNKDCTSPEICSVCGETGRQVAGHKWTPATCTAPETCSVCGTTQGSATPHSLTTRTYNDYSQNKVKTEKVCAQCGYVAETASTDLTTLLDSQHKQFVLPAYSFYQRLIDGAPAFDMLDGISFETGTADTSQLGEKAKDFTPPITINVFDGSTQCGTFLFGNYHGGYVTEWDASIDAPFNTITLMMDFEKASTEYAQLPMLFIAACDPTLDPGGMDTMLLAMEAFSGEGGVEHNGIVYSRIGGFFQAICVGALY